MYKLVGGNQVHRTHDSQVTMLGVWYKSVNFGAGKGLGAQDWWGRIDWGQS